MPHFQFYHLTQSPLEKALPRLVNKAYEAGFRVHVKLANEAVVEVMDKVFWTFTPSAFLAHGTADGASPELQPVLLATDLTNRNAATILCITDGSAPDDAAAYEKILDVFDGTNPDMLDAARTRWKSCKDAGHECSYFAQTDAGGWEKKA